MSKKLNDILGLFLGLLLIVLLNIAGGYFFERLDLTSDKRYSLSEVSEQQASELKDVIFVRVYLEGDLPADYKMLRDATKELLDEFRAYAGDNIQYEFIDPSAGINEKEREKVYQKLFKEGLQPTTLRKQSVEEASEKVIFAGAVVTYRDKTLPWQILKSQIGVPEAVMINNSVQQLEYEFASLLKNLTTVSKKQIAFIHGHGEYEKLYVADFEKSVGEFYGVSHVTLDGQLSALKLFDAIIVADPDSSINDKDKFIIDQFVMRGGKVMWLYEPVIASMDSLKGANTTMSIPRDLNLDDIFFKYGVRVNRDLIMDIQSLPLPIVTGQIGDAPRQEFFPWPYFPMVMTKAKNPIVKNLDAIAVHFASSIDYVGKNDGLKKTTLLASSNYSKLVSTPARISFNVLRTKPDKRQYNNGPQKIGVLIEGVFKSNFANRIPKRLLNDPSIAFKEESVPTQQIFLSDADIIKNDVNEERGEFFALGYDKYTRRIYANKDFLLNCMNYLLDDSGLLEVRAKEFKIRLLDRTRTVKEKRKWQMVNLVIPVSVIALFGMLVFFLRKKIYGSKG